MKNRKNITFFVIAGILAVVSIFLTIEMVTNSVEMASLTKEEANLIDQKRNLQESLVKGVSVTELQAKSAELGFVKPDNIVYVGNSQGVTGSLPVANLP